MLNKNIFPAFKWPNILAKNSLSEVSFYTLDKLLAKHVLVVYRDVKPRHKQSTVLPALQHKVREMLYLATPAGSL